MKRVLMLLTAIFTAVTGVAAFAVSDQVPQTRPTRGGSQSDAPPSSAIVSAMPSSLGTPSREPRIAGSTSARPDHLPFADGPGDVVVKIYSQGITDSDLADCKLRTEEELERLKQQVALFSHGEEAQISEEESEFLRTQIYEMAVVSLILDRLADEFRARNDLQPSDREVEAFLAWAQEHESAFISRFAELNDPATAGDRRAELKERLEQMGSSVVALWKLGKALHERYNGAVVRIDPDMPWLLPSEDLRKWVQHEERAGELCFHSEELRKLFFESGLFEQPDAEVVDPRENPYEQPFWEEPLKGAA